MGIRKNFIYSSILTVSGYLFPLITFPYVSRVLGVANIGICNFYDGVVNYFILFSMLGLVNLGIREIAKCSGNIKKIETTFSKLLSLNLITTTISIIILLIVGLNIPKLALHPQMIYIGAAKVLSNCLLIEWLYKGTEDFKYITIRSLLVRTLYVISIFIFVRKEDDYTLYFGLTTSMFLVNAIINLINSRRHISRVTINFNFKEYLKPFTILGSYQVLTSMYTTFNVVFLGFIATDSQVGYYSTAVKLYSIILSFYTAFSGVMLPRMSALLSENRILEFKEYIKKSANLLFAISIPSIILSELFAPTIIRLIAGEGFDGAITPMRIVMPLMLIIGIEQILVYQILFPLNKDKYIFINSIVGACTGILLNILLVKNMLAVGTAISWVGAELAVFVSAYTFVKKSINISLNFNGLFKVLSISIPLIILLAIFLEIYGPTDIFSILVCTLSTLIYFYWISVKILRLSIFSQIFKVLINRGKSLRK